MWKGFKQFIIKGNAVDLAVGVAIGASFGQVVTVLVKGIITPLIGLIGGQRNFSSFVIIISGSKFLIGDLLNAVITFFLTASVIYFFVITPMNQLAQRIKIGKPEDPTEKKCDECLSLIPIKAKKCKFCSSVQTWAKN